MKRQPQTHRFLDGDLEYRRREADRDRRLTSFLSSFRLLRSLTRLSSSESESEADLFTRYDRFFVTVAAFLLESRFALWSEDELLLLLLVELWRLFLDLAGDGLNDTDLAGELKQTKVRFQVGSTRKELTRPFRAKVLCYSPYSKASIVASTNCFWDLPWILIAVFCRGFVNRNGCGVEVSACLCLASLIGPDGLAIF